jgi:hypothetical protein
LSPQEFFKETLPLAGVLVLHRHRHGLPGSNKDSTVKRLNRIDNPNIVVFVPNYGEVQVRDFFNDMGFGSCQVTARSTA